MHRVQHSWQILWADINSGETCKYMEKARTPSDDDNSSTIPSNTIIIFNTLQKTGLHKIQECVSKARQLYLNSTFYTTPKCFTGNKITIVTRTIP